MIDAATRNLVRQRASGRCEYCGLAEEDDVYAFHIEHVVPMKHGGGSEEGNLALACHQCNLHKGSNLSGLDPDTGALTPLFNPRQDEWKEHFRRLGDFIKGTTDIDRTTVFVLCFNDEDRVETRRLLGGH